MLNQLKTLPEAQGWPLFDRWLDLMENGPLDAMMDFMKACGPADRKKIKALVQGLYRLARADGVLLRSHHGTITIHTECMLRICCFVCFEEKDVAGRGRELELVLPGGDLTLMILPWRRPSWFADTYSRLIAESHVDVDYVAEYPYDYFHFSYAQCLACERLEVGVLTPAVTAPRLILELLTGLRTPGRLDTFLQVNPEFMSRDVWSLFSGEFWNAVNPYWFPNWREDFHKFFLDACAAGTLDRQRVLRECLNAVGRNLSNNQISLYLPLFAALQPSEAELLSLSGELLGVVGGANNKAAADALKQLKNIAAHKDFPSGGFIAVLPVLLGLNIKSVQTPALAVAEILAKKNPQCHSELAPALAEAFGSPDEALQLKAAKCLLACGPAADSARTREELARRSGQMAASVKDFLAELLEAEQPAAEPDEERLPVRLSRLDPASRVTFPAGLDDLVFLICGAFVEPADSHASLIPDSLYAFRDRIDDELLARLSPAVTAARRTIQSTSLMPTVHSRTAALWFLRWYLERLARSDGRNPVLAGLKKKAEDLAREAACDYQLCLKPRFAPDYQEWPFAPWHDDFSSLSRVVGAAFRRIETGEPLPMLSSVTHEPFWIDPLVLVERLRAWQAAGREPDGLDLQLAVQRCALENKDEVSAAALSLEGDYAGLIEFLFGGSLPPKEKIGHPAWWVTAALTRPERTVPEELLGPDFDALPRQYFTGLFDWSVRDGWDGVMGGWGTDREFTVFDEHRLVLDLGRPKNIPDLFGIDGHSSRPSLESPLRGAAAELFAGPMFLGRDGSLLHQALALYPNNPEPLLMDFLSGFTTCKFWLPKNVFLKLMELEAVHGPAASLFTALAFMAGSRELRQTAAAFWRMSAEAGLADNRTLGHDLARLVNYGWAPVKRLTELIEKDLLGWPECSRPLAEMLEALLLGVVSDPPLSIKRLLEIYYELAAAGVRPFARDLTPKISEWSRLKGYDKVGRRLLKLAEA